MSVKEEILEIINTHKRIFEKFTGPSNRAVTKELDSILRSINNIPDEPECVKRWCVYEDGEPRAITKSYDEAVSAASFSSSADVVVKHVEICEAKK